MTNQTNALPVVDVSELSNFIRMKNGDNRMGAGVLAEHICEWFEAQRDAELTTLRARLAELEQQKPIGEFRESEYDGDPAFYWVDRVPPLGTKLFAAPVPAPSHVAADTVRLEFILKKARTVVVEQSFAVNMVWVYVEEGVMGDKKYQSFISQPDEASILVAKRKAIDAALLATSQEQAK